MIGKALCQLFVDFARFFAVNRRGVAVIVTVALKLSEEKWLLDLYGQDYADYMKRVNRCIPWPPRKAGGE